MTAPDQEVAARSPTRRRGRVAVALALGAAAVGAAGWTAWGRLRTAPDAAAPGPSSVYPGGRPIDAARISTGKLPFQVMPAEVTSALEMHSEEIVKTTELLEAKQARITGTCAIGSAIRLVGPDGSVVCQRLPKGVVSVAAIAAVPRQSTTGTAQGTVPGGVGRFQTQGADDFLVTPIQLPDGATVTAFTFTYFDADPRVDGAAHLYRSDDSVLASVATQGAGGEVRVGKTEDIGGARIDNSAYAYFVYFQVSAEASSNLIPIMASVSYRLP